LFAAGQGRVVGVTDEPDGHSGFVSQVIKRLPYLPGECVGNVNVLVLVPQWHDEIPDAHSGRTAVRVSHFAEGLHAAHFYNLDARVRVVRPLPERLVARQMALGCIARLGRNDLADARRSGHHQEADNQQ
jgi:hypothetical protein